MTEPFVIEELTGSRRSVELSDRALPYRPLSLPGDQRVERILYPGNPVATIQVLGPDEGQAEIRGRWKDRYIRNGQMITLTGWEDIVPQGTTPTVQDIVEIFHTLRRSGNHLEVRWGPEVRRGVMVRFEPTWHRLDVAEWLINFEWSQLGSFIPSPFTTVSNEETTETSALSNALADFNDEMARINQLLFPDIISQALEFAVSIASTCLDLITSVASLTGVPLVSVDQFQGVSSYAATVVTESADMRLLLGDTPPQGLIPRDDVMAQLSGYLWCRDMSSILVALAAEAVRAREGVRARAVSEYIADIRLREGQTLRDVSREYYGSPDDWTILADANGLVGSLHPPGTRVLVPRREAQS